MKILIADDHALFRDGLISQIEQLDSVAVILQSADYAQTLKMLDTEKDIDLLILDLDMPDMSWEEGFFAIKEKLGSTRIAIVSASNDVRDIKKSLERGACGYIPKRSDTKILSNALKLILEGGTYIPPEVLSSDFSSNKSQHATDVKDIKHRGLTLRQIEVLHLVAEGKSNKQIAYELGVSEATVKLHVNALLKALAATNRTQAVINAQKQGLI